MRVRITQPLHGSIDGIQLERFVVGSVYDVGVSLGCYLMALQAVEPVADDSPALVLPLTKVKSGPEPAKPMAVEVGPGRLVEFPLAEAADRPRRRSSKKNR
jgi:hypothetical protein